MLPHPTYDRLIALGLVGMAKAFEEQRQQPAVASLTFEERIGLLVDREAVERESRRLVTRLKFANLRQTAHRALRIDRRPGRLIVYIGVTLQLEEQAMSGRFRCSPCEFGGCPLLPPRP